MFLLWCKCSILFTLIIFVWFFPFFLLGWVHHGMPCCSPLLLCRQTWWSYHVVCCLRSGLLIYCVADAQRTWRIISWVICPLLKSFRVHATGMFFLYLADFSDSLHVLSCACQHRWELLGNYPVFTVVLVIYHYVEIIWWILVAPNFLYNICNRE